jgi:hypothetical protein
VLARLGISVRYGGQDLVESLKAKYRDVEEKTEAERGGEKDLTVKNAVFWDVAPCGFIVNDIGRTCRLHLQGRRNNANEEKCLTVPKTGDMFL